MKKADKISLDRYTKKLDLASSSGQVNAFESAKERLANIERAKKDFAFMVQRYFPHYATSKTPDFHIKFAEEVKRNPRYTGFCQWGRALSKSVLNNILLPFWLWMNGEPVYLVLVGSSGDRAKQLLEDIRAEFEANPQINLDFGNQHNPGNWEEGFFITKGGFIGQALGMGQSVRGLRVKAKRPTHIVPDDIETKEINQNAARQEKIAKWIERDLLPTMDGEIQRFIQANNKFSPRMIQTILQEKHPDWKIHQVNAYDPVTYEPTWKDKYTKQYFKDLEKKLGTLACRSEYNNDPHIEGTVFTQDQIQWGKMPKLNEFKIIYGFWDVAYAGSATSDYNAIPVQGLQGKNFWVIDAFVKQCKMEVAIRWMCHFQRDLPKTVVVHWVFEAQFWNDAVKSAIETVEIQERIKLNIIKRERSRVNKYDRMLTLQPYYQNGRIFYNEKLKPKNDVQTGLAQLFGIEPGYKSKDDYPDAHQGGIAELEKYVSFDDGTSQFMGGKYKSNNVW